MSFREQLENIVNQVPGATAGTLMGMDGIPIDTYQSADNTIDVTNLLIEYTSALQPLWKGEGMQGGAMTELMIGADRVVAVVRKLTDEYFLAVLMSPNGFIGKARYLMRLASCDLIKELT